MSVRVETIPDSDSPLRKAAVLVLALGAEVAREIFPRLTEREIQTLGQTASTLGVVTPDEVVRVLRDFREAFHGRSIPPHGAGRLFEVMLEGALGEERARDLIGGDSTADPYEVCAEVDPELLSTVLQHEHPQSIAIVLASLDPEKASAVLQQLGPELSGDVIYRMAHMGALSEEVRADIGGAVLTEIRAMGSAEKIDGEKLAVTMTKALPGEFSDQLLEHLEESDAEFAQGIRSQLFVFEDLAKLDSRTMQRLLREVDSRRLLLALKGTPEELQSSVFGAMSQRASEMLREDLEASPPVRAAEVQEAQLEILEVAFRLENEGAIALPRSGSKDMV